MELTPSNTLVVKGEQSQMKDIFTISDVAKKTGLCQDTIRYYEKINLLPPPKRKEIIIGSMFN